MNTAEHIICPLCDEPVEKLLYRFHVESEREVFNRIRQQHPGWIDTNGACGRCVDYYHTSILPEQRILPEIGPYFPVKSAGDYTILPTGLRLNTDPQYTGKGITICFIDSGFSFHPDLTQYHNRIKACINITAGEGETLHPEFFKAAAGNAESADNATWHGTMTSVVCAGDGWLSNGLYKGIASNAELVLLKVQNAAGKITNEAIISALQWVEDNHLLYGIRIVNMSLGGDAEHPANCNSINKHIEKLEAQGIVIVAAAGNDEHGLIQPPASSPHVITAGGTDDNNELGTQTSKLYHSSFGKTADGYLKPELLAHAIWIAAPILPGSFEEKESNILHELLTLPDDALLLALPVKGGLTKLDNTIFHSGDAGLIRQHIVQRISAAKYISPSYMHVDGTSFAAPIIAAIIAQMLEANPALTPKNVRHILFSTAERLTGFPAERQGFGLVQARKALLKVLKHPSFTTNYTSPFINHRQQCVDFYLQHDSAEQVALAGSFNNWDPNVLLLQPKENGVWKISIPLPVAGRYQYKFYINDAIWVEDTVNPYREPDGFNGLNSILTVPSNLSATPCCLK